MNKTLKVMLLSLAAIIAVPVAIVIIVLTFAIMSGFKDAIFPKDNLQDNVIKRAEYCRELTDKLALKDSKSSDEYLLKCLSEK